METKNIITGLIIIALAVTTVVYAVRSGTHASNEEAAETMTGALVAHLKTLEYSKIYPECRSIGPGRYVALQKCLEAAEQSEALTEMFREDDYHNHDAIRNTTGYLVIENEKGGKTFDSEEFRLKFNNEQISSGCTTPGEIAPGFTCRLDFDKPCEPGDNLEITYEGQRAYLKTC